MTLSLSSSLYVPRTSHNAICDRSFPVTTAKVLNNPPPSIGSLTSSLALRRALKSELTSPAVQGFVLLTINVMTSTMALQSSCRRFVCERTVGPL